MMPSENALYFNFNKPGPKYDIRTCPKNGRTTLTGAFILSNWDIPSLNRYDIKQIGKYFRQFYQKPLRRYSSSIDPPFRDGSIRVAVKRDPVKRFVSTCTYIYKQKFLYKNKNTQAHDVFTEDTTIDDIIFKLKNRNIHDTHFFTQSFYMNCPEDYDIVLDLKDLPQFLDKLEDEIKPFQSFKDLCYNISHDIGRYDSLTNEQVETIKDLYEKDYKYGWY